MVYGQVANIASTVIKRGLTYGAFVVKNDKSAWNKLYSGFPKYVKKGTREGFIAGSAIGTFIADDDGTEQDGSFSKPELSKTNNYYKTRRRPTRRSCRRYATETYTNYRRRCSSPRKQYRM